MSSPTRYGPSPRNRTTSFALALAITLGLFATLIAMGTYDAPGGRGLGHLVAMTISGEQPKPKARAAAQPKVSHAVVTPTITTPQVPIIPPPVVPTKNTYQLPEGFIQMNRQQMAAADIAKIAPAAPPAASGAGQGKDDSAGSGGGSGDGEGPGGARLYKAEWVREPTDAELAGYLPKMRQPGAWGRIACRTIDHFHVEDCRELGESPPGSGLARALRQAAWQFLIRPPRVDGKPQIGTWVSIHFDFREPPKKGDSGNG